MLLAEIQEIDGLELGMEWILMHVLDTARDMANILQRDFVPRDRTLMAPCMCGMLVKAARSPQFQPTSLSVIDGLIIANLNH